MVSTSKINQRKTSWGSKYAGLQAVPMKGHNTAKLWPVGMVCVAVMFGVKAMQYVYIGLQPISNSVV